MPLCFPKKLVLLFAGFLWVAMAILLIFKGGAGGPPASFGREPYKKDSPSTHLPYKLAIGP